MEIDVALLLGHQLSDGVREGRTLAELLQLAEAHCGPPAHEIRSMADEDAQLRFAEGCYVTERLRAMAGPSIAAPSDPAGTHLRGRSVR